jgi:hypothetical protein
MQTISQNLTRLQTAKTSIADAITAKGGTVSSGDGFEDFANDIDSIPTGVSGFTIIDNAVLQPYNTYGSYFTFDGSIFRYEQNTNKIFAIIGRFINSSNNTYQCKFDNYGSSPKNSGFSVYWSDLGITNNDFSNYYGSHMLYSTYGFSGLSSSSYAKVKLRKYSGFNGLLLLPESNNSDYYIYSNGYMDFYYIYSYN